MDVADANIVELDSEDFDQMQEIAFELLMAWCKASPGLTPDDVLNLRTDARAAALAMVNG